MPTLNELQPVITYIETIGGIFGGIAAIGWIARKLITLDRAIAQINHLTHAELQHNGGHSTKDYAANGYRKARKVERQVKELDRRLNSHLEAHANAAPTVTTTIGGTPDA